ncbi:MAG: hypothetical protein RLZZ292_3717, partial [Bacteroidota bacterium]|jgi:hypothetical protein
VPLGNKVFTLELVKKSNLDENFNVETPQSSEIGYDKGVFYQGIVKGDTKSVVALSFFEEELYGMIANANGNYVLGRIEKKNNTEQYLFYNDKELKIKTEFDCSVQEPSDYAQKMRDYLEDVNNASLRGTRCLRIFLEGDYALFQQKGNIKFAVNYLSALFHNVATLYQNEQISIKLSQVFVWDTPDDYHPSSPTIALIQFRNHRPNFQGDLGYLVHTAADSLSNRVGGLTDLNTLCDVTKSDDYGYTPIRLSYKEVPVYSWSIMVLAHELGHNLGSPHTQSCSWTDGPLDNCSVPEGKCAFGPAPTNGGTIMSYCHLTSVGIKFSNGFGALPGKLIRSRVGEASCLDICTDNTMCNMPNKILIKKNSQTSVTVNWDSLSSSKIYSIQWKRSNASTWITVYKINHHGYSLTGLSPNTAYTVRVRAYCSNSISDYSLETTFKTFSKEEMNQQPNSALDNQVLDDIAPQPNAQPYEGNNPILNDGLSVTPNPTSDFLNVNFKFLTKSNIHLSLLNLYGEVLYEDNFSLREGSASLDLSQYPAALYFVRARINEKEVLLKKVIKE